MVHQHHRIAVRHQIAHHAREPDDVVGVQADGGLIQHIEHAGGAVAHGAGQLHALPLARGERGGRARERQIAQTQIEQPRGGREKGFADAPRHGAHFLRQGIRHGAHPFDQCAKRQIAGFIQRQAGKPRRARRRAQARAAAIGAGVLLQKFFHALHALVVLHLGERVFHRAHGAVIGKTVVHDGFFRVRQIAKGHVRAHAHGAAHVGHQRPHQRVPGRDGSLVDGQTRIRHQRRAVNRVYHARAAAGVAGALAVEGQFLGGRREKVRAALGADEILPGGHGQRRRHGMPVRAAVAGQAGKHQTQAVQ